jgi:hypothetical protein
MLRPHANVDKATVKNMEVKVCLMMQLGPRRGKPRDEYLLGAVGELS